MLKRAITLGNFDGCHLGHQALFRTLKQEAESLGLVPTVVSFFPHTNYVLGTPGEPALLTTNEEKEEFIRSLDLDFITLPFSRELAALSYDQFIQQELCAKLGMQAMYFGHDHRFGRAGSGNYESISARFPEIHTRQLSMVLHKGERVSSSAVRNALLNGDVARAQAYLGRPYRLLGKVVVGKKMGKKIGFPTANVEVPSYKFIPQYGVYAATARTKDGRVFRAVVNIGVQPTVGVMPLRIEAHLLNFSEDIYGQSLSLDLLEFLRPERKFDSLQELIRQISSDAALAADFHSPFSDKEIL